MLGERSLVFGLPRQLVASRFALPLMGWNNMPPPGPSGCSIRKKKGAKKQANVSMARRPCSLGPFRSSSPTPPPSPPSKGPTRSHLTSTLGLVSTKDPNRRPKPAGANGSPGAYCIYKHIHSSTARTPWVVEKIRNIRAAFLSSSLLSPSNTLSLGSSASCQVEANPATSKYWVGAISSHWQTAVEAQRKQRPSKPVSTWDRSARLDDPGYTVTTHV